MRNRELRRVRTTLRDKKPVLHSTATASDTHHEADKVQLQLVRRMSPVRHIQRTADLSRQLKSMPLAALARKHLELSEQESIASSYYGAACSTMST